MSVSVSACGCPCTADSTASRGRVTRRAACRSITSNSERGGTGSSLVHSLERIKPGSPAVRSGGHSGENAQDRTRGGRTAPMTGPGVEGVTVIRGATTVLRDVPLQAADGELLVDLGSPG